jgi:hypothetical protein
VEETPAPTTTTSAPLETRTTKVAIMFSVAGAAWLASFGGT